MHQEYSKCTGNVRSDFHGEFCYHRVKCNCTFVSLDIQVVCLEQLSEPISNGVQLITDWK